MLENKLKGVEKTEHSVQLYNLHFEQINRKSIIIGP